MDSVTQRKYILWVRWVLIIATSCLLYSSEGTGWHVPPMANQTAILLYIASNVVIGLLPVAVFSRSWFCYVLVPADTMFVALAIHLAGAATTDFYLTFFFVIMVAAIARSMGTVVVAAFTISVLYGWISWREGISVSAIRIPFLTAVAIFMGHLVEQTSLERAVSKRLLEEKQELETMQALLRKSESQFRDVAESAAAIIFIYQTTRFCYVNPAVERISGYTHEELQDMPFTTLLSADFRDSVQAWNHLEPGQNASPLNQEIKIITKSGDERWLELSLQAIYFEGVPALMGTAFDVTERKRIEQRLLQATMHDVLTGLANKARLVDVLQRLVERGQQTRDPLFGLLYLDLDNFKTVNDSYGHDVGDHLLAAVAQRLLAVVRPRDLVARLGGDEFAIILHDVNTARGAALAAKRIEQELIRPFNLAGRELSISVSIGAAMAFGSDSPDDLIRKADLEMYRVKAPRKDRSQFSDQAAMSA